MFVYIQYKFSWCHVIMYIIFKKNRIIYNNLGLDVKNSRKPSLSESPMKKNFDVLQASEAKNATGFQDNVKEHLTENVTLLTTSPHEAIRCRENLLISQKTIS